MNADPSEQAEREGSDNPTKPWIRVSLDSEDHMRALSVLVLIGMIAAVALAIFGVPSIHFPPAPSWEYGIVVPTHGLLRASTALARGQFGLAWAFNPASYLVALVAFGTVLRWLVALTTRRWINVSVRFTAIVWIVIAGLTVVLWINQQLHADLIINETIR